MSKGIKLSKSKAIDEQERSLLVDTFKPEWQTFIHAIVNGESQTKAYMRAYPHITDEHVAAVNGSRLRHKAEIWAAIEELLDRSAQDCYQDLVSMQKTAVRVLTSAAQGKKIDRIQYMAAQDILDRTGMIRRSGLDVKAERDWETTAELLDD